MNRALAWLLGLGLLGCGTPANPPDSTLAEQASASAGSAVAPPKAAEDARPERASPPPPPVEDETPAATPPEELSRLVPTVPGKLTALPDPSLAVVVTLDKIEVDEVSVPLVAGVLPAPNSPPQAIVDVVLASEEPVAWFVDPDVPAATLASLIGILPAERPRVLVVRNFKGQEGALALTGRVPPGALQLRIASDGFHLAKRRGGKEYELGPNPAGDTFNYARLRGKAKAFRTKFPDLTGIRVDVEADVTVEVLAWAISQARGPNCGVDPKRCWLPDAAFGDGMKSADGPAPERKAKPKLELSKRARTSGAPGTVKIGKAKVGEGVDAAKADALLKRRAGFMRMCYFAALVDSPKLAGTIDLRLTLGADGKVIEVGIPESSLHDDAVEACLSRGLDGLRFAAPQKAPVAVDVSLTFKPR